MIMFTRTLVLLFPLLGSGSLVANGQQPTANSIAGRWEGAIDITGAANLPVAVTFTNAAAGLSASIDIQGAKGLPLRAVSLKGQAVHFELPTPIGVATFEGLFDGTTISGSFVQGSARGSFNLAREGAPKAAPAKRDMPYKEEEVTFKNGAVILAGTLSIPEGKGPFTAFVMVTGSGLQNRDEELFGFKPFALITDYLVRQGIATLRYDDRGAGGSTGNIAMATTADFADDALAGVALLASRPEIDHAHIGIFGHSEGADVSAIAAANAPDRVAFIIMMAGASIAGDVALRYQAEDAARALGGTDEQVANVLKAHRQFTDAVRANATSADLSDALRTLMKAQLEARSAAAKAAIGDVDAFIAKSLPAALAQSQSPWLRYFVGFDPADFLTKVKCPVFAMFGAKDTQVPPSLNRQPLEAALAKAGNTRLTVKVYPEANHLFIKATTGQATEYPTLEKVFVPGVLEDLASWVKSVAR
jgi:pimeloyl-ACP methyl ester carboxylesterase